VDDNAALREVLTEVVSGAGHSAVAASTVDGALSLVASFRPDLILLDTDANDGRGSELLDRMQGGSPQISTPVVTISGRNRQAPRDSPAVVGSIGKPFASQEVIDAIEGAAGGEDAPEEPPAAEADRHEAGPVAPRETLAQKGVSFGSSYVMFRSSPNEIHDLISAFGSEGYDLLVVTTRRKKTVRKRFRNRDMSVLTVSAGRGSAGIYGLGGMIDGVGEFVRGAARPVVAFDDMDKVMDRNGMNSTLTAIHQVVTGEYGRSHTFIVSLDPKRMTRKDREILLNHMVGHDPMEE